jgi:hypothetical protein
MTNDKQPSTHTWHFVRTAGFDQVLLESGADVMALAQLDQKLWAALSCPLTGIEFDSRTLTHIDTDKDGHIRVPEILAAVEWIGARLKNPDDLTRGAADLPLAAIDEASAEGREMLTSARQILVNLGKPEAQFITPDDTSDTARIFANTRFNGDGVVPPASAEDSEIQKVVEEIMDCSGSALDRCGSLGITQEHADAFFAEAQAYSDWWAEAENNAAILPLGEATHAAAASLTKIKAKVDDYFTRSRLAGFDVQAGAALNPTFKDYESLHTALLSADSESLSELPLAQIGAAAELPLDAGINPAWQAALDALISQVIIPILGARSSLSETQWIALRAKFAAFEIWLSAKQGGKVEGLGLARVREILACDAQRAIGDLIARDKALEAESNAIDQVDKMVLLHRDLFILLNNFVAFRDFYSPQAQAIFQIGTLYVDGRSCDLCVQVADVAKHATLANRSSTYLLYCDCVRRRSVEKMTIAAAVTAGDVDHLLVGRNGVFYDRQGKDWDATVVKIIEHPISVRQAFWLPYKRAARMLSEQIEKFAAAQDKAVADRSGGAIAGEVQALANGGKGVQAFDIAKFAGIFAAIGLALGAIGSTLAAVVTGFLGLTPWQMPLAILGVLAVISGPSMLSAYMKLRHRNLGPILDANGWAVNIEARINLSFGAALTQTAELPQGAQRSLQDPYAEKKLAWGWYLTLLALLIVIVYLWRQGIIARWWQ